MKILIKSKEEKNFSGDDGTSRPYFWYIGTREDGMAIRFGSTNGVYEKDKTYDILITEYEQSNGRKGFKELTMM